MKRCIVTGATGFVGANLLRKLLREGHEVHVLVRPGHNAKRIEDVRDQMQIHVIDLLEAEDSFQVVQSIKADWIFHLAAHGAYSWQTDAQQMIETNLHSTINLIESCAKVGFEAFVNTGSSSEYGFKNHPPREDEIVKPNSMYAITKVAATQYCQYVAELQELPIATLRLYSAYGPYEDERRFVPTLVSHGLKGRLPPLVNPDTARDYVYVEDVCEAYLLAATKISLELGAVYNIGSGGQTTIRQAVEMAKKLMKLDCDPNWNSMPNRNWDTSVWVANNDKAAKELGWQPKHDFEAGLQKTIEWMKEKHC
jgi:UDP-glucose 4-epimerase